MQPPRAAGAEPPPMPWADYPRALRYVVVGAVVGATARWTALDRIDPAWSTLTAAALDVAGAIVIGWLLGRHRPRAGRRRVTTNQFLLVGTGFAASVSSVPAYAVEVAAALDGGQPGRAAAVGLGTAAAAVLGAGTGYRLGARR